MDTLRAADLRFYNSQPDTNLHCETTDMKQVHRSLCLFTPQHLLILNAHLPAEG